MESVQYKCIQSHKSDKQKVGDWEARRSNLATEDLNKRNYARCEWKCIARLFVVAMRFRIKCEMTGWDLCNTLQRAAGSQFNRR